MLLIINKCIIKKAENINSVSKPYLICLLPSYEGQFVKCEYYLKVKISFDSMLIKDPEFNMPIDLGHTPSPFLQNFVFDVNKIIFSYNGSTNIPLMIPDNNINNDDNKKNNSNLKDNIQKVFGNAKQNINNKEENIKKIFGDINNKNNGKPTPENENQNNNLENSVNLPSLEELNMAKNEQAAPPNY